MTLFINEPPSLGLEINDVNLSSSNQEVDCDVQSLTSDDLPDTLSHCSPLAATSDVKIEDVATNCRTDDLVTSCAGAEVGKRFVPLLRKSSSKDDHLSKDTDRDVEPSVETGSSDGARKMEETVTGRERVIHICDHCGKSFIRGKEYAEHRRTHTGEKPFHCDVCGRGFSRLRSVATHRRQHTGERPFVCDICAKPFFTSGELLKHRRYHSGEKLYHCSVCGKQFLRSGEYTEHRRMHAGENVCLICGKTFTRLHNMKEHISGAHAGMKQYHCTTCGKQFAYSSGLRYHRRLHKSERPFKCQECGKCFARMGELNRHRRGTHKIVNLL